MIENRAHDVEMQQEPMKRIPAYSKYPMSIACLSSCCLWAGLTPVCGISRTNVTNDDVLKLDHMCTDTTASSSHVMRAQSILPYHDIFI